MVQAEKFNLREEAQRAIEEMHLKNALYVESYHL